MFKLKPLKINYINTIASATMQKKLISTYLFLASNWWNISSIKSTFTKKQ